jgi:hypothetical protein
MLPRRAGLPGVVRAPEELLDDAPHERGSGSRWSTRSWPQLCLPRRGRQLTRLALAYFGRAPLIGEHNQDIFCGELGLSSRTSMLAENSVI